MQLCNSYSISLFYFYSEQKELAEQSRCCSSVVELRSHLDLFNTIKERIEYLADKLQHVTLVNMILSFITTFISPNVDSS